MAHYVKVFDSIIHSTVWQEEPTTKVVWITMLALADSFGEVQASVPGLAKAAGVSLAECEKALSIFLSPDPYSRSKTAEGRRIEEIPGGWELINYSHYRALKSLEQEKELSALRSQRYRDRKEPSRSVTVRHDESRQEEEDVKEDVEIKKERSPSAPRPSKVKTIEQELENLALFDDHVWKPYSKRVTQTGQPCGKGHKPKALALCLALKGKWGIDWQTLKAMVELYKTFPNVKNGHVQAVEVYFGENGHWMECWQKVKDRQPLLLEEAK